MNFYYTAITFLSVSTLLKDHWKFKAKKLNHTVMQYLMQYLRCQTSNWMHDNQNMFFVAEITDYILIKTYIIADLLVWYVLKMFQQNN